MDKLFSLYGQFLNYFPSNTHGLVSLILTIIFTIAIYKVLKQNFIFIILLIVLLPASVPILKNLWDSAVKLLQFLLTSH